MSKCVGDRERERERPCFGKNLEPCEREKERFGKIRKKSEPSYVAICT